MLLRIEDIDKVRCTPKLEAMMLADLEWIGFEWDGEPRRQSMHFGAVQGCAGRTAGARAGLPGLPFPDADQGAGRGRSAVAVRSRWRAALSGIRALTFLGADGSPHGWRCGLCAAHRHGEGDCRRRQTAVLARDRRGIRRRDGNGRGAAASWGDAILGRKDTPASYHLACVLDDALQGVTHVVRGADLFHATSIHRLLQELLALPAPVYHHHRLILGPDGTKLSKSRADTAIAHLRDAGVTPPEIRRMIGL